MARALARKKTSGKKSPSALRQAKKVSDRLLLKSKSSQSKRLSSPGALKKARKKTLDMKIEKKGVKRPKTAASAETGSLDAETRKPIVTGRTTTAPEVPPPLLRDSKTTAPALNLLEKGIKLIYHKDFRKARMELESLIKTYPGEPEIVARARSYIQICDREEAAHKKSPVTNDQAYTLGVMEHNRGNYDAAIANFRQSLEEHPNADYIFYSLAASLAMKGSAAEAIQSLRKAIELSEDNRIYAKNDGDFSSLHSEKEFAGLVGIGQAPNHESQ